MATHNLCGWLGLMGGALIPPPPQPELGNLEVLDASAVASWVNKSTWGRSCNVLKLSMNKILG